MPGDLTTQVSQIGKRHGLYRLQGIRAYNSRAPTFFVAGGASKSTQEVPFYVYVEGSEIATPVSQATGSYGVGSYRLGINAPEAVTILATSTRRVYRVESDA
jgi:hypothetical protein